MKNFLIVCCICERLTQWDYSTHISSISKGEMGNWVLSSLSEILKKWLELFAL